MEEAQRIITTIRQMEASLDGGRSQHGYSPEDDDLRVTYPLTRCLTVLREKHMQISKLHRERFEQVKSKSNHFIAGDIRNGGGEKFILIYP